ncbi:hypothetical protein SAMD00019534_015810 [Acytostelium subglobosum LB1]|uniref:hypothetical protein n=1 Tax=Acytostelium subglobosum LB1 TaxID=1410327 RepID=UPI000644A6F5|nr:hypothetical protein SAMD00019534_015810 [Acytostelium subglobosum LB1]GAM18406.1 hypothetical protein SAMD00019534_015810 [Acytostelium subglobosum LB1]|eukprot:XP_012757626.1 hypothetical protein SAMD00019534_015810 [Acytostelium subglobosum LB1]
MTCLTPPSSSVPSTLQSFDMIAVSKYYYLTPIRSLLAVLDRGDVNTGLAIFDHYPEDFGLDSVFWKDMECHHIAFIAEHRPDHPHPLSIRDLHSMVKYVCRDELSPEHAYIYLFNSSECLEDDDIKVCEYRLKTLACSAGISLPFMKLVHERTGIDYGYRSLRRAIKKGCLETIAFLFEQPTLRPYTDSKGKGKLNDLNPSLQKLVQSHAATIDAIELIRLHRPSLFNNNPSSLAICRSALDNPSSEVTNHVVSISWDSVRLHNLNDNIRIFIDRAYECDKFGVLKLMLLDQQQQSNNNIMISMMTPKMETLIKMAIQRILQLLLDKALTMGNMRIIQLCSQMIQAYQHHHHHLKIRLDCLGIANDKLVKGRKLLDNNSHIDYIRYGAYDWFVKSFNNISSSYPLYNTMLLKEALKRYDKPILHALLTNPSMTLVVDEYSSAITNFNDFNDNRWQWTVTQLYQMSNYSIPRYGNHWYMFRHPALLDLLLKLMGDHQQPIVFDREPYRSELENSWLQCHHDVDLALEMFKTLHMRKLITLVAIRRVLNGLITFRSITPIIRYIIEEALPQVKSDQGFLRHCYQSGNAQVINFLSPITQATPGEFIEAMKSGHHELVTILYDHVKAVINPIDVLPNVLRYGYLEVAIFILDVMSRSAPPTPPSQTIFVINDIKPSIISLNLIRRLLENQHLANSLEFNFGHIMYHAIMMGDRALIDHLETNLEGDPRVTTKTDYQVALGAAATVGDVQSAMMIMSKQRHPFIPLEWKSHTQFVTTRDGEKIEVSEPNRQMPWRSMDHDVGLLIARYYKDNGWSILLCDLYSMIKGLGQRDVKLTEQVVIEFIDTLSIDISAVKLDNESNLLNPCFVAQLLAHKLPTKSHRIIKHVLAIDLLGDLITISSSATAGDDGANVSSRARASGDNRRDKFGRSSSNTYTKTGTGTGSTGYKRKPTLHRVSGETGFRSQNKYTKLSQRMKTEASSGRDIKRKEYQSNKVVVDKPDEDVTVIHSKSTFVDGLNPEHAGSGSAFTRLGLHRQLVDAMKTEMDISIPSTIQQLAIPEILAKKKDVLFVSQTGTGKTLTYLLPIVQLIKQSELAEKEQDPDKERLAMRPRVVVLVPTRELVKQVTAVAKQLSHGYKFSCIGISGGGGGDLSKQIKSYRERPYDVLVSTPGILIQMIENNNLFFGMLEYLVVDEADSMFTNGKGFDEDMKKILAPIEYRLKNKSVPNYKTVRAVCCSATLTEQLMASIKALFPDITKVSTPYIHKSLNTLEQQFISVKTGDKHEALLRAVQPSGSKKILVFCNTPDSCRSTEYFLTENGYSATSLHGLIPNKIRAINWRNFTEGDAKILVCTDIASRGIDNKMVDHVVLFDFPSNPIDYLHRIGRTARAGQRGTVTCIIAKRDQVLANAIQEALRRGDSLESLSSQKRLNVQLKQRQHQQRQQLKQQHK